MNKQETLIELLNGSTQNLSSLKDLLTDDGLPIHDEAGYVDTDFLMKGLVAINKYMDASVQILRTFTAELEKISPTEKKSKKGPAVDAGKDASVEDILKQCRLENNVIYLPNIQFSKESYAKVKQYIEETGGKWKGGKTQGFVFDFDAARVFEILHSGKRCNLQQEFQYFATPAAVADKLVELVGPIPDDALVLEPSAGRGALVDAIHRVNPSVIVDCYELMPENMVHLKQKSNICYKGEDFTISEQNPIYDYIIANPPFSKNQDIDHIMRMWKVLKKGGKLAAIMSCHWQFSEEKRCVDFRDFLNKNAARIITLAEKEFAESGTNIKTCMVYLQKSIAG